ncbi:MAG: PD-(D/E)XK nuclease family transposase, partial [Bacteroidales bacterium]|nr:PD-(D/E)XK nuclease family transposase [Bacteroidales bacterium]
ETEFDKWLYAIKNLATLMERPAVLQEAVFQRLFEQAEIAQFNREELNSYLESQKDFWDLFAVTETAEKKGRAEGMAEGMAKGRAEGEVLAQKRLFRNMYCNGFSVEQIAQMTSTSLEEVEESINDAT